MGGLATAVSATPAGGKIFLRTDAGAKDEASAPAVAQAAKAKNVAIMVFKFANFCDSPAAFDLVAPGRFYDELPGSEAASTASFAEALIVDDSVDLTSAIYGPSASAALCRRQSRILTIDVAVNDTVKSVGFSVNTSAVTMTITRPDGSVALPGDPGVSKVGLTTGNTIMVEAPTPGTWEVTLRGDDAFSFNSFAKTNLLLPSFNFVEPRGTHHEGLFPVLSPPAPGSTAFVVANIAGKISSASFEFRPPGGTLISYLELSRGNGTDGFTPPDDTFYGLIRIPERAYFIYVRGDTSSGKRFVRVVPGNLDLPFGDSGNMTLPGTNSTTTAAATTTSSMTISPKSPAPSSSGFFGNSTAPASSRFFGNSTYTSASATSTLCPTCQPKPCVTPITSLTRTVIYLTSSPVAGEGSTTAYTTSSVTTELPVPCFAKHLKDCPSSLPVISPRCGSLPPPALGGGTSLAGAPSSTTITIGVATATATIDHSGSVGGGTSGEKSVADAYPAASTVPGTSASATGLATGLPTSSIFTAGASERVISMMAAMICVSLAMLVTV